MPASNTAADAGLVKDAFGRAAARLGKTLKLSAYVTGSGADESAGLQQAFTAAATTGAVLECDVLTTIGCATGVTIGDNRANSLQKTIVTVIGSLKVKALASMTRLVTINGTVNTSGLDLEADAGTYANFAVYGLNWGRATLGRVQTIGGSTAGFYSEPSGNNNCWTIDKLRVTGASGKHVTTGTITARSSESGWAGTGDDAPYTTWELSTPLPAALAVNQYACPAIVFTDGRFMQVRRVVDTTHVEVFNENRALGVSESVTLVGAAVNIPYYGDVGVWTIGNADVRDNPNAAALSYGGYGGQVGTWAQQNNYAGAMILKRATGITFGHFYTELSGVWLIVRDTTLSAVNVGPGANSNPTNWQGMNLSWMSMTGRNKQPLHWSLAKPSGSPLTLPPAVPIDPPELTPGTRNITPGTVQAYRRTSGNFALRIDNNYTSGGVGLVTLACPTTGAGTTITLSLLTGTGGHTIEGASTWAMTTVGTVTLCYWLEGTDWKVRTVGQPVDTLTSISATPNRVGQVAVSGGQIYMAAGTSSTSDWKQVS